MMPARPKPVVITTPIRARDTWRNKKTKAVYEVLWVDEPRHLVCFWDGFPSRHKTMRISDFLRQHTPIEAYCLQRKEKSNA